MCPRRTFRVTSFVRRSEATHLRFVVCLIVASLAACGEAFAQGRAYETLGSIPPRESGTPSGRLLALPDGRLFGSTTNGGRYFHGGSLYALTPDGAGGFTFEELHAFAGPDGRMPRHGVILGSDGRYYGTTYGGGAADAGTIFTLDSAGHLTQIYDFAAGGGEHPSELVEGPDGKFYGTAPGGAAGEAGTLFRIDAAGTFELLHIFGPNGDVGHTPQAGLVVGPDGRLWGTAAVGGASGRGTVYAVDVVNGSPTAIHGFSGPDGWAPTSALTVAGGDLFGTTASGGAHSMGTVFRITTAGAFTSLYSFTGGADGAVPDDGVTLAGDGNLYGITPYDYGPPPPGGVTETFPILATIYRITTSGDFTTVYTSTDGTNPHGPLTLDPDGNLYAAYDPNPAASYGGEVARISLTGTVSPAFVMGRDHAPFFAGSNLVESQDGGLYGLFGGDYESAIVRVDRESSDFSVFFTFPAGEIVANELRMGSDGNLYASTAGDNVKTFGTVFRVDSTGARTTLHTFSGTDGAQPPCSVVEAPGPEFWGVTKLGGANGLGTIYKLDAQGGFASIHDFDGSDGSYPEAGLARAADGTFYGTTNSGGTDDQGTLFKIDSLGAFSTFHSFRFSQGEGFNPTSAVLVGSDGYLYGTTPIGGSDLYGTIYKLDGSGNLTTLKNFDDYFINNDYPGAALIEVGSGDFFGTASWIGFGEVFHMDTAGNVTSVHDFGGSEDGRRPLAPLVEASDGALYGTASSVYRLLPSPLDPSIAELEPPSGRAAGGASVAVQGHHFREGATVTFGGLAGSATYLDRESRVVTLAPAFDPGTLQNVTVSNGDGTTTTRIGAWFSDFLDTPGDHLFHDFVVTIFRAGITAGCGGGDYCPASSVRRDQMAVFLLKAKHGPDFLPPDCTGVFPDVPCDSPFAKWVEQLAAEGIAAGCGDGNYCPADPVRRDQMAVFLLKSEHGSGYVPPLCAGIFLDVACPSLFADWIEQLKAENITGGCGGQNYCASSSNNRGQMAAFLVKTFSLE